MLWNRPRHSQGNAVVERAHGVCQRWAEAATCPSAAALQRRLGRATALQRERYPAVDGRRRLAADPALAAGGGCYDPAREGAGWDERRVWTALGDRVWPRRVDQGRRISPANRALGMGRAWAGREATVRLGLAAAGPAWPVRDPHGALLRRHPAPELGRGRIPALDASRRRPRPLPAGAKPRVRPGAQPYAR